MHKIYSARCAVCGARQSRLDLPIKDEEHVEHSRPISFGGDVDEDVVWETWAPCSGLSVSVMGRTEEEWQTARDRIRRRGEHS